MSLQEIDYSGSIVSTGSPVSININAGFDEFHIRNLTTLAAGSGIVESIWYKGMNNYAGITNTLAGGTITSTVITAAGFTYYDTATATIGPAYAITAISKAAPGVASSGTTPVAGQIVRIYGTTSMLQIAGMDFTVGTVAAGVNFQLAYLTTSAFANTATGGYWRLLPVDYKFYPRKRYITAITQAASAVVTLSVTHGYEVGEYVYFTIPSSFGMVEMNGLTGQITAIDTTANTVTLNINSSAFTAFAFPTSATAAAGSSFANMAPAGEVATLLDGAITDSGARGITLGSAICGTAGDVMEFWAYRSES